MGRESCSASTALVFVVGLVAGTGCTVCSKVLFQMTAIGMSGEEETFTPPVFQVRLTVWDG